MRRFESVLLYSILSLGARQPNLVHCVLDLTGSDPRSLQFHYSGGGRDSRPFAAPGFEDHPRCSDAFGKFSTITDSSTGYQEWVLMGSAPF